MMQEVGKCLILKRYLFLLFFACFAVACSSKKQVSQSNSSQEYQCMELQLFHNSFDSIVSDFYQIESLAIKDSCMEVVLNYGGGCGEVKFQMYYTNKVMESMPPQTLLYLVFDDNDPCRSIVRDTLKFSLKPFKRFADRSGIYFKLYSAEKSILYQVPK